MARFRASLGGIFGSGVYATQRPQIDVSHIIPGILEGIRQTREGAIMRAYMEQDRQQRRMQLANEMVERGIADTRMQQQFDESVRQHNETMKFNREKLEAEAERARATQQAQNDRAYIKAQQDYNTKMAEIAGRHQDAITRAGGLVRAAQTRAGARAGADPSVGVGKQISETQRSLSSDQSALNRIGAPDKYSSPADSARYNAQAALVAGERHRLDSLTAVQDTLEARRQGRGGYGLPQATQGLLTPQPAAPGAAPAAVAPAAAAAPPTQLHPTAMANLQKGLLDAQTRYKAALGKGYAKEDADRALQAASTRLYQEAHTSSAAMYAQPAAPVTTAPAAAPARGGPGPEEEDEEEEED